MKILFDLQGTENVVKDLHAVSQCDVSVIDLNGKELAYCRSDSRRRLKCLWEIPGYAESLLCAERDAASRALLSKSGWHYCSFVGLTYIILPILAERLVVGFVLLENLLENKNAELTLSAYLKQFDNQIAFELLSCTPVLYPDRVRAIESITAICCAHLVRSGAVIVKREDIVENIASYICQNIDRDISVASICSRYHVSRTILFELFRKEYGMGVMEFVSLQRLNLAKKLLRTSSMSVKEIAAKCGFRDQNYFSRVFKKNLEISPVDFRKLMNENGA